MACLPGSQQDAGELPEQDSEAPGQAFLETQANIPLQAVPGRPDRSLPKGPGEKRLELQGTVEETQRLRDYLSQRMAAQSALHMTSRKSVSTASWIAESHLATVTSQKGSYWTTHGHTHSRRLMLEAHEALFLMEMGCLKLEVGGLPMTLQQTYHTLIGDHLPLQQYTVIASLKRCGCVVKRAYASPAVTEATPTPADKSQAPLQLQPSCPLCHPQSQQPPNQYTSLFWRCTCPPVGHSRNPTLDPPVPECVWCPPTIPSPPPLS